MNTQKLRVKITGCSHPDRWYSDSIEEEFNVVDCSVRGNVILDTDYTVWEDYINKDGTWRHIAKSDCIVIQPTVQEPEDKGEKAPVYEVIADYPNNTDFPRGKRIEFEPWMGLYWQHKITDCQGERMWLSDFFDKYPHLFQKL